MKRLFAILMICVLLAGIASAETVMTVTGGWLRLRDAPSYDSGTIASYYTGTKVTVLSTVGEWSYVRVSDSMTGYMLSAFLTSGHVSPSPETIVGVTGYVTSSNGGAVALRTGAGTGYPAINYYKVGTQLTVLGGGSTWSHVQIGSTVGYMMSKYITFSPVTPPSPAVSLTAYVTSGNGKSVNMRSGAGTQYGVIGSYPVGTKVTVLQKGSVWNYIQVGSVRGYMMAKFLTSKKPGTPTPVTPVYPTPGTNAYVTSSNGKGVRLRSGPGTQYSVIGVYNVGTPVTVITAGSYWCQIQAGTQIGYMMSKYLTSTSPSPVIDPGTPVVYTAYIVSSNGKGVYLRTGPVIGNNVIALYPVGTMVKVLKSNGAWDYVSIGTQTGYMMHQFLTTSYSGSSITSVSVSNTAPKVNDTLVAVVVPGGATAKYTWMREDGSTLSTNSYYVVMPADVGWKIRVQAEGTGSFSGSAVSAYTSAVTPTSAVQTVTGCAISNLNPKVGDVITASCTPSGAQVSYIWYRENGQYVGTGNAYTVTEYDKGYALYAVAIGYNTWTGSVSSSKTAPVQAKSDTPLSGSVILPAAAVVGKTLTPTLSLNSFAIAYHWRQNGVEIATTGTLYLDASMAGDDIQLVVSALPGSGYSGSVSSNYCLVQTSASSSTKSVSAEALPPTKSFPEVSLMSSAMAETSEVPVVEWITPETFTPPVVPDEGIPVEEPAFLPVEEAAFVPETAASPDMSLWEAEAEVPAAPSEEAVPLLPDFETAAEAAAPAAESAAQEAPEFLPPPAAAEEPAASFEEPAAPASQSPESLVEWIPPFHVDPAEGE